MRDDEWEKGYAYDLLDFVEQYARDQKAAKLRVGLINENVALREWYKTQDFAIAQVKNFDALPFSICMMEKSV